MSTNHQTARFLRRLGALLELEGEARSRNRILCAAADAIEAHGDTVNAETLADETFKVGEEPARELIEYFERGTTALYEQSSADWPLGLVDVVQVKGIGAGRARKIHEAFGVEDLEGLIKVAESGNLTSIKGIGARSAEKIAVAAREFADQIAADDAAAGATPEPVVEAEVEVEPEAEVEVEEVAAETAVEAPATEGINDEVVDRIRDTMREATDGEDVAPEPESAPEPEDEEETLAASGGDWLWEHLRCAACHHVGLEALDAAAQCPSCGRRFAIEDHVIDMMGGRSRRMTAAQRLMEFEPFTNIYESLSRPALTRLVTARDLEDAYALSVDLMDLKPGMHVLDVACGPGNFTRRFADALRGEEGAAVIGIDVSGPMLRQAREQQYTPGDDGLFYLRGDARHLPFPDASFDRVHCSAALHLFDDPQTALGELFRVIKPGGMLIVSAFEKRAGLSDTIPRPSGAMALLMLPVLPAWFAVSTGLTILDKTHEVSLGALGVRWMAKGALDNAIQSLGAEVIESFQEGMEVTIKARR